jgi:hypothetical protein
MASERREIRAKRGARLIGWVDVERVGDVRYVVTTHSGYRAELQMCVHDAHIGRRETCIREVGGALSSARCSKSGHCHSGHPEHVDAFVKKLVRTYA